MKWTPSKLRSFEKGLAKDFEAGKINCPLHLSGGNEKELIEIFKNIKRNDYVFSTHRNHYHYLLHQGSPTLLRRTILKKNSMRSMNFQDPSRNFYTSAIVGGNTAVAVGVALGLQRVHSRSHVWCFLGDGATDGGHFWEAVRLSTHRRLPLTFIVEDNNMSVDSTIAQRWGEERNIIEIDANLIIYRYTRTYPHVGCGVHVTF